MAIVVEQVTRSSSSIDRSAKHVLIASWLGWMFDGYETYALILVMAVAVKQVLPPERLASAPIYMAGLLSTTLFGWAIGGVIAGVLTDYIGRRRVLMLSILWYAAFAGLTALSWNYWSLLAFRFLTGFGLGAEWGPGSAIVAEFWPPSSRGRAGGALHAAHGVGTLVASTTWLLVNPLGPSSWRYMFVLGVAPALILLYVRRVVHDPVQWWRRTIGDARLEGESRWGSRQSETPTSRSSPLLVSCPIPSCDAECAGSCSWRSAPSLAGGPSRRGFSNMPPWSRPPSGRIHNAGRQWRRSCSILARSLAT